MKDSSKGAEEEEGLESQKCWLLSSLSLSVVVVEDAILAAKDRMLAEGQEDWNTFLAILLE